MSIDRIVSFPNRKPTSTEVDSILRNYLGACATKFWREGDTFYAVFHGKPSFPFAEIAPLANGESQRNERGFEVDMNLECPQPFIDVITRQADEFTGCVADGFAKLMARFYKGEYHGE